MLRHQAPLSGLTEAGVEVGSVQRQLAGLAEPLTASWGGGGGGLPSATGCCWAQS